MAFDVQHGGETDRTGLGLDESRGWKRYPGFFSCSNGLVAHSSPGQNEYFHLYFPHSRYGSASI